MISWLKGQIVQKWYQSSKEGIVIDVSGVGYEVQLLKKHIKLIDKSKECTIWVHQIEREDCTNLYGFVSTNQRNLFRKLISVSGIGAQIGMALLDDLEVEDLINAIEENDLSKLTRSQGIGKRIAERLVLELKNKLQTLKNNDQSNSNNQRDITNEIFSSYLNEIKSILNSLGYLDNEIKSSLEFIRKDENELILTINSSSSLEKKRLMDNHLKEILIRLSQKST